MKETTDLVNVENLHPLDIFKQGGVDAILLAIREKVIHDVADTSTVKGRNEIASRAQNVARSKVFLDTMGKELADKLNAQLKPINEERKKLRDNLDALKVEIRGPLTEWEENEKNRTEALEKSIEYLHYLAGDKDENEDFKTAEILKKNLAELQEIKLGDHWEEYAAAAGCAKDENIKKLTKLITERVKYETEQAELERLRQEKEEQERLAKEAEIRKESAEQARLQAEAIAEQARIEAEQKTERARIEAANKANAELARVTQAKVEAEQKAQRAIEEAKQAAVRERERVAIEERIKKAEDEQRKANIEHRANINNIILAAFIDNGFTEVNGKKVITLIAKGLIPYTVINY